jgi:hypothetical protein
MKNKSLVSLLLVIFLISACAPSKPIVIEETPAPVATEESIPDLIQTEGSPELPVASAWRPVRDPRYGFGFAIPCWWLTNPISEDNGLQTIRNYDDAYFQTNNTKGFWDWPNGTFKLDIVTMEGIDPTKSDADAYMQFVDPTMAGLVSIEQQAKGSHTATVLTLSNLVNTADPDSKVFLYRLSPDKLLMVVPIPQSIIETPDFQAFLTSTVLTQDEQIALPIITPAPALINSSCAG